MKYLSGSEWVELSLRLYASNWQYLQYFMKQEPQALKKFREFTQDTIQHIKTELIQECFKAEYATCAMYLSECMESLQNFIHTILSELGSEYVRNMHKISSVDVAVLNLQNENKQLHQKLAVAHTLLQEKEVKISTLQNINSTLRHNIANLQNLIAGSNSDSSSESQDTLENLDLQDVEEYVSPNSSLASLAQQIYQLEDEL